MTSPLRLALRARLVEAMRARDKRAAGAIRSLLAALENAEALPASAHATSVTSEHVAGAVQGVGAGEAPRRILTVDDERAVLQGEVAELRDAASTLAAAGQEERASDLVRIAESVEELLAQ